MEVSLHAQVIQNTWFIYLNQAHTATAKEEQGNVVLAIHFTVTEKEAFYQLYNANKTEHLSYEVGMSCRVAKLLKEHWLIVLH